MADVARLAQVSAQTVSRVINDYEFVKDDTRERVLRAVEQLNYRPNVAARTLANRKSRTIGVVATDYHSYGPAATLSSVEAAARSHGYGVSVMSLSRYDSRSVSDGLAQLTSQGVDGVIFIAPQSRDIHTLLNSFDGVPVVTYRGFDDGHTTPVTFDSVEGSRLAVRHLIEFGHERIVHLSGPSSFGVAHSRTVGWLREMAAAGLATVDPVPGDWTPGGGYAAGVELLKRCPDATAAYVANDHMALGLMLALHRAGRRVPDDFSVVGFDDIPEAAYTIPPLTTMRQDFSDLGSRLLQALLEELDGSSDGAPVHLVPDLIARESTARPAG